MLRYSTEQLQFIVPRTARIEESVPARDLLFPAYSIWSHGFKESAFIDSPSMYRNILAWYLKASGMTGIEIGDYLSISSSRANGLALRTRKKLYSGMTITLMQWSGKNENIEPNLWASHMLEAMRSEMSAAEQALSRCRKTDHYVISGALRLGRSAYIAAMEAASGIQCPCKLCSLRPNSVSPYWIDETETN